MSSNILREEWRPVVGFEGLYEVSDHGRVRSRYKDGCRTETHDAWTIRRLTIGSHGYYYLPLSQDKRHFGRLVHRLVLEAFVGPCPKGMQCRHLDGNRLNNRLENLTWGTPAENCQDTVKHGRSLQGERSPLAKLTGAQVMDIRARRRTGESRSAIARDHGISVNHVSKLCGTGRWKHIPHDSKT